MNISRPFQQGQHFATFYCHLAITVFSSSNNKNGLKCNAYNLGNNYWDSHFLPNEKLFIYCIDKTSDSMFQRVVTLSSFDQDWWWNPIVQFMDVHIILQLIVTDTWKTWADAVLLLWLLKHLSQKTVFLGASPTQMIPSRQVLRSDMLREYCTLYDG